MLHLWRLCKLLQILVEGILRMVTVSTKYRPWKSQSSVQEKDIFLLSTKISPLLLALAFILNPLRKVSDIILTATFLSKLWLGMNIVNIEFPISWWFSGTLMMRIRTLHYRLSSETERSDAGTGNTGPMLPTNLIHGSPATKSSDQSNIVRSYGLQITFSPRILFVR